MIVFGCKGAKAGDFAQLVGIIMPLWAERDSFAALNMVFPNYDSFWFMEVKAQRQETLRNWGAAYTCWPTARYSFFFVLVDTLV